MRRAAVALALLAALAAAGCGEVAAKINDFCRDKGGVLSADYHGATVVCGNKRAYDR